MRAYLRLGPSFGVSMPWWMALFAGIVWLMLALIYLFYVGIAALLVLGYRRGHRAWLARHPPGG